MKNMKAVLALAVMFVAVIGMVPMAESDADLTLTNNPTHATFDSMNGGSFSFKLINTGNAGEVKVTVTEGSETVYSKVHQIEGNGTDNIITVSMGDFKSIGKHHVVVTCESLSGEPFTGKHNFSMQIDVNENVLTSWTTYVVIIIVIIVIAILIYMKVRDKPKAENTMTFEELEAQRKIEMSQKADKKSKKSSAASTERRRYLAEKKKKQD